MDDNKENQVQEENQKVSKHGGSNALSVCGIVGALAAWTIYFAHGLTAMIVGVVAFVLSILGAVYSGKGCLHDLSVTSAIASGVLVVVFIIFYWVLPGIIGPS